MWIHFKCEKKSPAPLFLAVGVWDAFYYVLFYFYILWFHRKRGIFFV